MHDCHIYQYYSILSFCYCFNKNSFYIIIILSRFILFFSCFSFAVFFFPVNRKIVLKIIYIYIYIFLCYIFNLYSLKSSKIDPTWELMLHIVFFLSCFFITFLPMSQVQYHSFLSWLNFEQEEKKLWELHFYHLFNFFEFSTIHYLGWISIINHQSCII